jgi:UDP-arabinose 4-epimerase
MGAVLVTGGAGYVGSHACKALATAGEIPITFDNLSAGHATAVRWGPLVEGSVCNSDVVLHTLREHNVDAVMHFAGSSCVAESVSDPKRYFYNNVVGSLTLLDAAIVAGVKHFVFSSSAAVYGDGGCVGSAGEWREEGSSLSELAHTIPTSPYGESKEFVERVLHRYRVAYGLRSVSLRYFNAAGADAVRDPTIGQRIVYLPPEAGESHDPETHLIPLAIEAALTGGVLNIYGTDYPTSDGTAVRDYVHVTDLADAHVKALKYLRDGGESRTLNLGAGVGYSVKQVIDTVEHASGKKIDVQIAPRRVGDPAQLVASVLEAKHVLGWTRTWRSNLNTIVQTALAWRLRRK